MNFSFNFLSITHQQIHLQEFRLLSSSHLLLAKKDTLNEDPSVRQNRDVKANIIYQEWIEKQLESILEKIYVYL